MAESGGDPRSGAGGLRLGLEILTRSGRLEGGRAARWQEIQAMARLAEDVGFDTLFFEDHYLQRGVNYAGQPIPPEEAIGFWECWTMMSAVAAVTGRITIGPYVACTSFHNPALLAKMADTLDEVSGGRLILGLGAGWHEPEYRAFGFPFDHRASRFEEALRIIVPLLRTGTVNFEGRYYQARECELRPRGPRRNGPPIWIGGRGPRMLGLVARWADGYDTYGHLTPEAVAERYANLDAALAEAGRDPAGLVRSAATYVTLPGPDGDPGWRPDGLTGSPDELAEKLLAFTGVGVEHLTVILSPADARGIERFAPVIERIRKLAPGAA